MAHVIHRILCGLCAAAAALWVMPVEAVVTYSVGASEPLLPPEFYAGQSYTHPGVPSISVPQSIAGRSASFPVTNPIGDFVAFRALNLDSGLTSLMGVEIETGHVIPLTNEGVVEAFGNLSTSPDGRSVYADALLINRATGEQSTFLELDGFTASMVSVSSFEEGRFAVGVVNNGITEFLVVGFVNEDGTFDDSSSYGVIASGFGDLDINNPRLSPNGDKIAFEVLSSTTENDVYVLEGLLAILASGQTNPTVYNRSITEGLGDSRVLDIRASQTPNFVFGPFFDFTGDSVVYSEDINGTFDLADFSGSLSISDFDIFISNSNGTATTDGGGVIVDDDMKFPLAGNQAIVGGTLDGRVLLQASPTPTKIEIFIAPVEASGVIDEFGGSLSDLSGTTITVPAGSLGGATSLMIVTPFKQELIQNVSAELDGILLGLRQFGPTEAKFDSPVTIEISYTDDQILTLDPTTLRVLAIDAETGENFAHIDITNVVNDTENNLLSFQVSSFGVTIPGQESVEAELMVAIVGEERADTIPPSGRPWLAISVALLTVAGVLSILLYAVVTGSKT